MEVYLKPKNILVLGGGSGIGYAAAQRLLDGGAQSIVLASRNIQKLYEAAAKLNHTPTQKIYCAEFKCRKALAG